MYTFLGDCFDNTVLKLLEKQK